MTQSRFERYAEFVGGFETHHPSSVLHHEMHDIYTLEDGVVLFLNLKWEDEPWFVLLTTGEFECVYNNDSLTTNSLLEVTSWLFDRINNTPDGVTQDGGKPW